VSTTPGKKLLWATWILTAVSASCPAIEFLVGPWLRVAQPSMVVRILFGVYSLFWFFLWVTGKIVAVVLGVLVLVVFLKPTIPAWTRLVTAAAGVTAGCLLLYWTGVVNRQW